MRWLVVVALLCVASAHALESQTVQDVKNVLASVDTLLAELSSKVTTRTVRDHLEAELEAENAAAQAAQGLPETISNVLASSSLDQAMQAMTRSDSKQNQTNSSSESTTPANGQQGTEPVTKFNDQASASTNAWSAVVQQLGNVAEQHARRHHQHHHPLRRYAAEYNAAVMNAHAAELSAALKKVAAHKAARDEFDAARTFSQAASQVSSLASQEQRRIESSSAASFESTPVVSKSSSSSGSSSFSSSSSGSSSGSGSGSESLQTLQDKLLNLLSKRAFATREEQEDLDVEIRKLVVKVIKAKGGKSPVNHHLDLLFNLVKKVRTSFDGLRGLSATEVEDLATQVRAFLMLVEKRQGELLDEKDQAIFCGKRLQEHCSEQRNHCIGACVVKRAVRGNTPVETISCPWSAYQKCTTTYDSCTQKQNSVCGVLGAASGSSSGSSSGSFKSESSKKKRSESSVASSSSSSGSKKSESSGSSSGSKKSESSGSKKKASESTSKKELDRLDGMEVTDLKKAAAKDATACKKKLATTCAEARLKCQKSCKSETNEFYEFCDNDRCKRENEQCHKVNEKVCSGKLVIADVVQALPRAPNCEDSEDIECGTRRMPVTPITVDSHSSFSPADDSRHSVSSCDSCQARRAICRTQCQLARLNNSPCSRNQCQAQQERCDRTCKPSVVAMDPALAVLPIQSTRTRSNVNCPSDAPYCHVKPLHVPRGYLPHRYF